MSTSLLEIYREPQQTFLFRSAVCDGGDGDVMLEAGVVSYSIIP